MTNTGRGGRCSSCASTHCCADGIALVQVLNRIARRGDGRPLRARSYTRPPRPKQSAGAACRRARRPRQEPRAPRRRLRRAARDLGARRRAEGRRRVPAGRAAEDRRRARALAQPAQADQNAASAAEGAAVSINDVVFAAAAGAIRRHTHQTAAEAAVDGARVHALVPSHFRAPPTRRSRTSGPSSRRRCRRAPHARRAAVGVARRLRQDQRVSSTRRWRRCSSRRTRSCRR